MSIVISIIIPSYNQGKFLEKTLSSIVGQNCISCEIIVIDGGSTDNTADVIAKYKDYIYYVVSETDKGQVDAINKGIHVSRGEWICWQNSDDFFYLNALHIVLSKISTSNSDIGLITANINIVNDEEKIIRDIKYVKPTLKSMLTEGMVIANQAAFWRKKIHLKIGFPDEKYNYSFDYDWFLRLLVVTKAVHINETLGAFRHHEGTKTSMNANKFLDENRIIKSQYKYHNHSSYFWLRKIFLLAFNREFQYIFRGFVNRVNIKAFLRKFTVSKCKKYY